MWTNVAQVHFQMDKWSLVTYRHMRWGGRWPSDASPNGFIPGSTATQSGMVLKTFRFTCQAHSALVLSNLYVIHPRSGWPGSEVECDVVAEVAGVQNHCRNNKIGTNVSIFNAAPGKAGLCAFWCVMQQSRKSYKSKILRGLGIELEIPSIWVGCFPTEPRSNHS